MSIEKLLGVMEVFDLLTMIVCDDDTQLVLNLIQLGVMIWYAYSNIKPCVCFEVEQEEVFYVMAD